MRVMMTERTDWLDSVWSLIFSISSIAGGLWFCEHVSFLG